MMNINSKAKGFVCGVVAAATYGTNPLSTLPLYKKGMSVGSVLFYRYGFAVLILGILMKMQGQSSVLKESEILLLVADGLFFSAPSLLLFLSYKRMDAGITSTILFVYPMTVTLTMLLFFHEKMSLLTVFYILFALSGVGLLCKREGSETLSLASMLLVILSSPPYIVYIVGVSHPTLRLMSTTKLAFYVLLSGLSIYIVRLNFCTDPQAVPSFPTWGNILVMAFLPIVVSLVCTTVSIHSIGSTPAAILGALKPVTTLFFGVMIFSRRLTPRLMLDVLMILVAVILIVVDKPLMTFIKEELAQGMGRKLIR